ncbi:MAG: TIGR02186 family protein [Minwuia sp.]|nr:TIGR02186 family protein [Minwuia sp.]
MKRLLIAISVLFASSGPAQAEATLVSDISAHRIGITSSYTGTELLLFGALGEGGGDVVIVVRGPDQDLNVRRKARVGGIWLNTESVAYRGVPGFYAVASNRPLSEIASPRVLKRNGIGIENLRFTGETANDDTSAPFASAIRRRRIANGLYSTDEGAVSVIYDRLFRADIPFPANVPVGNYNALIYLFQDGQVVVGETKPIIIDKSGIERAIFIFAKRQPALYGIFAVIVACLAGWGAAQFFRKR